MCIIVIVMACAIDLYTGSGCQPHIMLSRLLQVRRMPVGGERGDARGEGGEAGWMSGWGARWLDVVI